MDSSPLRLFTLGPEGTFSDKATQKLKTHLRLLDPEASPEIVFTRTIPEVLARTEADREAMGVFPIENSDSGTVVFAQDSLVKHKVTILLEINLRVRFSLLAKAPLAEVRGVLAQPVAYDQCNAYLAEHLPDAEVTFTTSNTQSGRDLLAAPDGAAIAAIVPLEFGEEHQQLCAAADIQNNAQNITRFLVVRSRRDGETFDFERHKTSLLVEPEEDRPGLLYDLLSVFNSHHLNLVRLESRPAGIRPWSYVFFIDFHNNARTPDCLSDLRNDKRRIRVLGSYDTLE